MWFNKEADMTANKDLKKRIRDRQAKTGESYTTARSHIIRTRDTQDSNQASESERIIAIVLKCNVSGNRTALYISQVRAGRIVSS
jgi:hypothetical protein